MKTQTPKPFMFEEGKKAVLLLHGFTGHSADVRMLGRFLQKQGYTTYAPIYRGHGKGPEALTEGGAKEWWADVQEAYQTLKDQGYQKIAVAGLSLGGVLGLKLAYSEPVMGIIPMCTPMILGQDHRLDQGFRYYAKQYKKAEGKEEAEIEAEVEQLIEGSSTLFSEIADLIREVKNELDTIYTPALVVQAEDDHIINTESANYILDTIESDQKEIKWYKEAGHAITLGPKREQVHQDIYQFLESLDWD
ncbi:alpha/beta hydrolase [Amphibacillus sp. Q70]|uniref:alpha/beta hydrolase n=1 Tax=Amphibacillus sp. Q70 TaxID=3453416 RepID=UPI003F87AB7B